MFVEGIIWKSQKGLSVSAVINNNHYCPNYMPGDAMHHHMEEKPVWAVEVLNGKLESQNVTIFSMKYNNYVMIPHKILWRPIGRTSNRSTGQIPCHQQEGDFIILIHRSV